MADAVAAGCRTSSSTSPPTLLADPRWVAALDRRAGPSSGLAVAVRATRRPGGVASGRDDVDARLPGQQPEPVRVRGATDRSPRRCSAFPTVSRSSGRTPSAWATSRPCGRGPTTARWSCWGSSPRTARPRARRRRRGPDRGGGAVRRPRPPGPVHPVGFASTSGNAVTPDEQWASRPGRPHRRTRPGHDHPPPPFRLRDRAPNTRCRTPNRIQPPPPASGGDPAAPAPDIARRRDEGCGGRRRERRRAGGGDRVRRRAAHGLRGSRTASAPQLDGQSATTVPWPGIPGYGAPPPLAGPLTSLRWPMPSPGCSTPSTSTGPARRALPRRHGCPATALGRPDRVAGLVPLDTSPARPRGTDADEWAPPASPPRRRAHARRLRRGVLRSVAGPGFGRGPR